MHVEDFRECSDEEEQEEYTNEQYFESYGTDIAVTKAMLDDKPRMQFYRDAIAAADLRGKIVVDVGAGTGILSLMAARAGARRVISIEASAMAVTMQHVVRENGPDFERTICVLQLPAEKVTKELLVQRGILEEGDAIDVIISEWMGFYLLHENMLPSVLRVRDELATNGVRPAMLPATAAVYAAPVDLTPLLEQRCRKAWADVDGFNLSAVGRLEEATILACNPCVHVLPEECVLAPPETLLRFDLNTVTERELEFLQASTTVAWGAATGARDRLAASRIGATLWGFAVWFDVASADGSVALQTGPADLPTHWKQTVVLLPDELRGEIPVAGLIADNETMTAAFELVLNRSTRSYEISLSLQGES